MALISQDHFRREVLHDPDRRHAGRPLAIAFGQDELREWYDGWQPLPWFEETRVGREVSTDELVSSILQNLGRPGLHNPTSESA
ncbi:hypothetical protein M0722_02390 [Microbacterium sp. KSW4-16]|uniref:hypothetical protein n=1 Tax=Microbacterium TaxID=33882 RepID=UPI0018841AA4|nr:MULTISPECIES: hypothetical protein [Microbacterium]MCK8466029.1 hypothetical protein [Microbacterium aurugineum]